MESVIQTADYKSHTTNSIIIQIIIILLSLIFAFSETFWSQSVIAKGGIYTLNIFLILSSLYVLFIYKEKSLKNNNFKPIYIFSFFSGLMLVNHHTSLALFPAYFLFIVLVLSKIPSKVFIISIISFLLGIVFYLYLPLRASTKPIMNWGDPYSLEKMIFHITRKQYSDIGKLPHSFPLFLNQAHQYLVLLLRQFTPYILLFVPVGIYGFFRKDKILFLTILLAYILTSIGIVYTINYEITSRNLYVNEVFYIPSFFLLSFFVVCGFIKFFEFVNFKIKNKFIVIVLQVSICIFLFFLTFKTNYNKNNRQSHFFAYDYGLNILKSVKDNSIIFTEGDNMMFVLGYLKFIECRGSKVTIYDDLGVIFDNIYGENFLRIPRGEREKIRSRIHREVISKTDKKVYFPLVGSKRESLAGFRKVQKGILYEIVKDDRKEEIKNFWNEYNLRGVEEPKIYKDYLTRDIIAQYYIARGEYYYSVKEKDKSFDAYKIAGKIGYDSEWVSNNLSVIFLEKGFGEDAEKLGLKAIEVNPKSAREYSNLATIYYKKGDYRKALEYYNKAISIEPNYAEAYNGIGTVYALQNKLEEALEFYKKALIIRPNFAESYANIGIVMHMKGQVDSAVEYYNKALMINPNHVEAHSNLGVAYESKGKLDKAFNEYRKAIELKPDFVDGYHNLGVIYYKRGDYKSSIMMWEKAVEINPDYEKAKINIERAKKILQK